MSENVSEIMSEKITDRWVISRNDNADMMSGEEKRFLMESTIFTDLEKTFVEENFTVKNHPSVCGPL